MKSGTLAVFAAALAMVAGPELAVAADAKVGAAKAYTCLGCHAVPNYTNAYPTYRVPKLGGQHPEAIIAALKAYKSGERRHSTMNAQAQGLSEADMADLAAYFAAQQPLAKK
jgi:cytochrome c553